jgi:hypothetical protein
VSPCSFFNATQFFGKPSDDPEEVAAEDTNADESRFVASTCFFLLVEVSFDPGEGVSPPPPLKIFFEDPPAVLGNAEAVIEDVVLRRRENNPDGGRNGKKEAAVVELERGGGGAAGRGPFTDPALAKLSSSSLLRIST